MQGTTISHLNRLVFAGKEPKSRVREMEMGNGRKEEEKEEEGKKNKAQEA